METIRKCSSGKFISIWILQYFSMEYQISGVLGEIPLTRGTLLYKVRILPRSPQRKTEMLTTRIAGGSKENLQKFLRGEQFWQNKNNKAGDEKMKEKPQLITKSEELMEWISNNDLLLELDEKEAKVLLGYLEGHDYAIGVVDEKMVRVDICDENYEYEDYSIDEFIDTACEWNYDLMIGAKRSMGNASNHIVFNEAKEYFEQLRADEKVLDKLFAKTCYGKQLKEVCAKMTQDMISKMDDKVQDIEHCQRTVR